MRRLLSMVVLGLGGLSLAVALSLGAFAIAGNTLREPINPVVLTESSPHTGSATATSPPTSPEKHHGPGSETDPATPAAPSITPSADNPVPSPVVTVGGGGGGEPGDDHNPRPSGGHGGDD